jgi:hypothetical protein
VFGPILESSRCSLRLPGLPGNEVDEARVGSCRGCFVGSLLGGDAFPRGGWDGWASLPLHRPTVYSFQLRGHDLPIRHHLVLSLLISVAPVRERKLPRA